MRLSDATYSTGRSAPGFGLAAACLVRSLGAAQGRCAVIQRRERKAARILLRTVTRAVAGRPCQESSIGRLAAEGLTNPEIGTRMFISSRTVQYHLAKVFQKLEINSRGQLTSVA